MTRPAEPASDPESTIKSSRFLEKASYRQRRLRDVARVLPVLGAVLMHVPLLWPVDGARGTADALLYLFCIWCLLIAGAALMARRLRDDQAMPGADTGTNPDKGAG
jgi:hypothetical protein